MSTPAPPQRARRRPGLRATLVALLVSTVAVICLAVGLLTHASVRTQLHAELDDQLDRASSRAVDRELPEQGEDGGGTPPAMPEGEVPGSGEFELTALVEDGQVTSAGWRDEDGELRALDAADVAALEAALDEGEHHAGEDGEEPTVTATADLSIGSYRVLSEDSGDGGAVVTGLPLDSVRDTLRQLDLTLLAAGLGAVIVAGVGGSLLIRRALRPLDGVARLASEVAETPLDRGSVTLAERVPARHTVPGTEVGEVGRALNHLLDNVEGAIETRHRSEERMRRFIGDASHELRTPLTAIRGYTEMLRLAEPLSAQGLRSVDRLDAQSARMTSLVEDLLLLTRLDDGAPRSEEDVDLGEVVLESVMDARATAPGHGWDVSVPDAPVTVHGDARQLTQVVVNLLSNARKHTPAGTRVAVRLDTVAAAPGTKGAPATARLQVRDDGPGIDPELLPDIFSRFTRADRARSGSENTTGLGLSIVKAIAEAHGGGVAVASRSGETVFTLTLPLLPA
ncbi:sensor histidine kinase [Brachybacterium squillarum]|uniref:sensor histidine kinase n=1 Tax=Brachybacterium squillarum TaxID=661979 RepID=UPI00026297A8|nr:HAMP domain-containing sensor histidine kinase [Brachybacterium squillarum]